MYRVLGIEKHLMCLRYKIRRKQSKGEGKIRYIQDAQIDKKEKKKNQWLQSDAQNRNLRCNLHIDFIILKQPIFLVNCNY